MFTKLVSDPVCIKNEPNVEQLGLPGEGLSSGDREHGKQ